MTVRKNVAFGLEERRVPRHKINKRVDKALELVSLLEFADRRMLETQVTRVQKLTGMPLVPGNHPLLEQLTVELGEWFVGRRRSRSTSSVGTPISA